VSEDDQWLTALRRDRNRGDRSFAVTLLLSVFLGWLGADRMYLGYWGLGFIKALTLGAFGLWWLFDLLLIATDNMTDVEGSHLG
jgi:TM2 domain-containing membrane protein YozV